MFKGSSQLVNHILLFCNRAFNYTVGMGPHELLFRVYKYSGPLHSFTADSTL